MVVVKNVKFANEVSPEHAVDGRIWVFGLELFE